MAEEFTLDQGFWNGGTVDRYEGFIFPRAVMMDGPGYELLSSSTLAMDEYGGLGVSHLPNYPEDLPHLFALSNDIIERVSTSDLRPQ